MITKIGADALFDVVLGKDMDAVKSLEPLYDSDKHVFSDLAPENLNKLLRKDISRYLASRTVPYKPDHPLNIYNIQGFSGGQPLFDYQNNVNNGLYNLTDVPEEMLRGRANLGENGFILPHRYSDVAEEQRLRRSKVDDPRRAEAARTRMGSALRRNVEEGLLNKKYELALNDPVINAANTFERPEDILEYTARNNAFEKELTDAASKQVTLSDLVNMSSEERNKVMNEQIKAGKPLVFDANSDIMFDGSPRNANVVDIGLNNQDDIIDEALDAANKLKSGLEEQSNLIGKLQDVGHEAESIISDPVKESYLSKVLGAVKRHPRIAAGVAATPVVGIGGKYLYDNYLR